MPPRQKLRAGRTMILLGTWDTWSFLAMYPGPQVEVSVHKREPSGDINLSSIAGRAGSAGQQGLGGKKYADWVLLTR